MELKNDIHVFTGMQKDIDISKHKPEYLIDALNIRITPQEGDSLLAITNEKGPKYNSSCVGVYVGHTVIDSDNVVVFLTHSRVHKIVENEEVSYVVSNVDSMKDEVDQFFCDTIVKINLIDNAADSYEYEPEFLYVGNLGFDSDHPIESLYVYESSDIKKIYWVDGKNQPRVINIENVKFPVEGATIEDETNISTQFDFVQELALNEEVSVTRNNSGGIFAPGVIQYAFSYYHLYGQESNIFYTTPLNYISFYDRGASPEEKVPCSFTINVNNVERKFDYIRIYSIHRTSIDATPTVKIVKDIKIEADNITFTDNGTTGEVFDNTALYYIGGESIIASHIATKDNTLFLGDIKLQHSSIDNTIDLSTVSINDYNINYNVDLDTSVLSYNLIINSTKPGFKYGERYQLGVQFQDSTGKWSNPINIDTYNIGSEGGTRPQINDSTGTLTIPGIEVLIEDPTLISTLKEQKYLKARPVCMFPTLDQRRVITQGVICPSIYSCTHRIKNQPYAQASWFFRPHNTDARLNQYFEHNAGAYLESRHNVMLPSDDKNGAEVQGAGKSSREMVINGEHFLKNQKEFCPDRHIITLNSPEVEFDSAFDNYSWGETALNIVGLIEIPANVSLIDINTSSPSILGNTFSTYRAQNLSSGKVFSSDAIWMDALLNPDYDFEKSGIMGSKYKSFNFMVYPWQRTGSLNNDRVRPVSLSSQDTIVGGSQTSILKNKKLLHFNYAKTPVFFSSSINYSDIVPHLFDPINNALIKIKENNTSYTYLGNIDTELADDETNVYVLEEGSPYLKDVSVRYGDWTKHFDREGSPVSMKYKSTRHLVFALPGNNILPRNLYNNLEHTNSENYPIVTVDENTNIGSVTIYHQYNTLNDIPDTTPCDQSELHIQEDYLAIIGTAVDGYKLYLIRIVTPTDRRHPNYGKYCARYEKQPTTEGTIYEYEQLSFIKDTSDTADINDLITYSQSSSNEDPVSPFTENTFTQQVSNPYLLIGELINANPLSFDTDSAWIPAGEPVNIDYSNNEINLIFSQGDTWYQRYDCLKTFPYTREDENSIIEILSFICETRINVDGRYDKNKGVPITTAIDDTNFNKLNEVYNQTNNFFRYYTTPEWFVNEEHFPNQFTWTLENTPNQQTDNWTDITLANTYTLEGRLGKVSAFTTVTDKLLCFQDHAVNRIIFNPRVEISPSDSVPIEITSSKKMQGIEVLSDTIGCSNKRSIVVTNDAVFFLDDNTQQLYELKDKFTPLADTKGFSHWFKQKENFNTEKSFYDYTNNDLYLVWDDTCLVYNTKLAEFTSFMSYEGVPAMFNMGHKFYCFDWYYSNTALNDNYTNFYTMFEGDYNTFFGIKKKVNLSFISNQDSPIEKIFSTVEMRMDVFDVHQFYTNLLHDRHFDYIQVWNEYQDTMETSLTTTPWNTPYIDGSSKKKFRVWRTDIPRDWLAIDGNRRSMHRIRNTWAKFKFGFNPPSAPEPEVVNLVNTNNPNIAKFYEGIEGNNIMEENIERVPILRANSTEYNDYAHLKMVLHDINVNYLI